MKLPTYEEVREAFVYEPETGRLLWRQARIGAKKYWLAGSTTNSAGYLAVHFKGAKILGHRIIWLWMTGSWPAHEIDHIDKNPLNNEWANLRQVTRGQNQQNRRIGTLAGAVMRPNRRTRPWCSHITVNRKQIYLGSFATQEEAHAAYMAAKQKFHPFYESGKP